MTMYYSRSGWGALPPNRESADRAETSIVFVHHDGVALPRDANDVQLELTIDEAKARWAAFQRDHLSRVVYNADGSPRLDANGNVIYWADLAYNTGAGPGVILEGRGWDVRGGGTGPGNKVAHPSGSWDNVSVSICVLGNYQVDVLDDATRASLIDALREARDRYGDELVIMGDRDVNSTACCGDNLYSQLHALWVQSSLEENDMATPEEIAAAVWAHQMKKGEYTASMEKWIDHIHEEFKSPGEFQLRLTNALVAALPKAGATTLTYDDVFRAVQSALKAQAAILAAT